MNWLAHLFLSEPVPEYRIGNLLPDLLSPVELQRLPARYAAGITQHRRIDSFTDAHPIVDTSRRRIHPSYRRFAGILIDIFYDHLLARDWSRYSGVPFTDFAREVYGCVDSCRSDLPTEAMFRLDRMCADDWLQGYREISGVSTALDRIGARLRRPQPLIQATAELTNNYDSLAEDFAKFFPELMDELKFMPRPSPATSRPPSLEAGSTGA